MLPRRSTVPQRACGIFAHAAIFALAIGAASAQTAETRGSGCPHGLNCTVQGEDADRVRSYVDEVVGGALNDRLPVDGHRPALGAIVGVSWHGRRTFFGYGRNTEAFRPDTIVEIGSITKVFTTALLAEAVQERGVDLDGKLADYASAIGLNGLTRCGANVTLRQLADFSSGMPRLPGDLPRDRGIGSYSERRFKDWVSGWTPRGATQDTCPLPESYVYSNASVGLLGYIVSHQFGMPYGRLVADRITTPLRMSSTFLPGEDGSVPAALAPRIAVGRANDYEPVGAWPYYAWFAAGALRSDAEDMLSFGEAALGGSDVDGAEPPRREGRAAALESALKMAQTTTYPVQNPEGGPAFDQGLAWVKKPGDPSRGFVPLYFKDGGTDGFSTIVLTNPAKRLAIFIAVGKTHVNVDLLGVRLARAIR